jgi:hypothetical protein
VIHLVADGLGLLFLAIGIGYLQRPDVIARIIVAIRETILNDAHVALERKKWGLFFLLLSLLSFYLGLALTQH